MPRKKAAMKELRKRDKKTARNKQVKRRLHDIEKDISKITPSDKAKITETYKKAQKIADKGAKKNRPFNKRKASRIKSRIAKKLNKLSK